MVLKFLHIQSHFIHLYFLTVFEVIFYIYYIMPYEKTIFSHLFDDDISMLPKLNTTNYISESECSSYQNKLDRENKYLWDYCFIYIASSSALFLIVFLRDIWKNYNSYKLITTTSAPSSPRYDSKSAIVSFGSFQNLNNYKKNDDTESSSVEMVTIPKLVVNDNNSSVTTDIIENPTFVKYYWHNSGFLSELIKTLQFIVLVGIFEYLFFAYIVNKFKIANSKTILCSIYKKIS